MYNKILITGGAGYVGTTLVPLLLKLNYRVLVIDTFWFGDYLPKHKCLSTLKKREIIHICNLMNNLYN